MEKAHHQHVSRAGSLSLRGGCLCLDFANTSSGRGSEAFCEHLQQPGDLALWAAHAKALSPARSRALLRNMQDNSFAARNFLRQALALREAIYGIGSARSALKRLPSELVSRLSTCCKDMLAEAELVGLQNSLQWRWRKESRPEFELLGGLALSALALFADRSQNRIKQCKGEGCGWLFLDSSRNNSRRWCDMEVCGNRAKMRRFRERSAVGRS